MARLLPSGTPTRSTRYVIPAATGHRWRLAALAGVVLLSGLTGLYLAGVTRVLSPGDLATAHVTIDLQCAQCHESGFASGDAVDVRCERCHDVGGSERLTHAGHVLFGSADALKADAAAAVACAQCHIEHQGRAGLASVDDRECSQCHVFRTLRAHPQFAAITAAIQTGLGLKFDHDRHLVEVRGAGFDECQACHVPTADQRGFAPIRFDDQCAACHTDDEGFVTGNTDPIEPGAVLAPADIPEPWAAEVEVQTIAVARGRSEYTRMRHADRWTLYNARRFRRALDPEGEAMERELLRGRVAYLEQQLTIEPLTTVGAGDLAVWADAFERDVAALERQLRREPTPATERTALDAMVTATRALATAVSRATGVDAGLEDLDDLTLTTPDGPGGDTAGSGTEEFDVRRNELLRLIDAVQARGDERLSSRVATLRDRVNALRPQGGGPDTEAYRSGLFALDQIVRVLRDVPDAQARVEVAELEVLRSLAQQRITGGLTPAEFEERRRQLLSLLATIAREGSDELRSRAAPLRQWVLALRPGADGDAELRRRLRQRRRSMDRVRVEMELTAAGGSAPISALAPLRDNAAVRAELDTLRRRLADLEGGSRPGVALADDRERQGAQLESLLVPCLTCHELSGPKLAQVRVAEPVMTRARFDHAPHVIQTACAACHASVTTSGLATDVNVPGVETCQSCHRPREARADCATCHVYHPPSVAALLREP
ncbi:MAG: cytochrome c3 family protein [Acidobacteria bacterium]|nr:cytochrome c3 family protein [Acidobacteriota bacterium]